MSPLENLLAFQLCALGIRAPVRELVFAKPRLWRFDFAWPDVCLAVEVDGGSWVTGRHTRGKGFEADCEKLCQAVLLGWRVLRVTGNMVRDGRAVRLIEQALVADGAVAICAS